MLNQLAPVAGARHTRKRVGRGIGSGLGKTSGRGENGETSRSGGATRPGFEGGQIPFFQRLPKRGFKNVNRKEYAIVNLSDLNLFEEGSVVTVEELYKMGLVKKVFDGVKVLGNGKLEKKLTVKANKFSESAKNAITTLGGSVEEI